MAINKSDQMSIAPGHITVPATGGLVPPNIPGHSPGIGLPYDLDGARQHLAEAGYPDGRDLPPISMLTFVELAPFMEIWAAQWHDRLGIDVRCETVDWHTFYRSTDRHHVYHSGWEPDYPDPDNFLRVFVSSQSWKNDSFIELVENARRISDQDERMKLYRQADQILVDEAAIVPMEYPLIHIFAKPWVRNSWEALVDSRWKDVVIEPH